MTNLDKRLDKLEQQKKFVDDWTHAPHIPEHILKAIETDPDLAITDPELYASLIDWQMPQVRHHDKSK